MSAHTPGPWAVDGSCVYAPDGAILAQVCNPGFRASDYPLDENARLMAAAPDMLAMLQICHEWLQGSAPHRACAVGDVIARATRP